MTKKLRKDYYEMVSMVVRRRCERLRDDWKLMLKANRPMSRKTKTTFSYAQNIVLYENACLVSLSQKQNHFENTLNPHTAKVHQCQNRCCRSQ